MARIVCVEDDDLMGSVVHDVLTAAGHQVRVAADGARALAAIAGFRPDMVVLDVGLSDESGLDLLRVLRAKPETSLLLVMMLTTARSDAVAEEAMNAGATAFMTKPFTPLELAEAVEMVLAGEPVGDRFRGRGRSQYT
ncbi:MAG TPA: response regulator [Sphingomicrobium sp.]